MTQNLLQLLVTSSEHSLLEDIEEIGYGELHEVVHDGSAGQFAARAQVTPKQLNFIKALRRIGKFPKVVIHDSEPTQAEYPATTSRGRKCLIKIRF
jgi:hypothetical protein